MDDHRGERVRPSVGVGPIVGIDPSGGVSPRAAGRRPAVGDDRGSVTAELAVALPAVVLVLVAVLVIALAGAAQLRVTDAARAGARAAAAGETDARVLEIARRTAGSRVDVSVQRAEPWVTVVVEAPVAGGWFGGRGLVASAASTAWLESAVVADGAP